jgi:hypothetical protein
MQILFTECLDFYFDQLETNSCSNNGMSIIIYLLMKKYNIYSFIPSRLFLYYNGREFVNDTDIDKGTTNNGLFYALDKYGICPEVLYPFDISKVTKKPNIETYEYASTFPVQFFYKEVFLQEDWIEVISKALLNRQFILITIKREGETSSTFKPVGDFHTFPIVDYIKYYHHVLCVGIDTDKKLLYLLNSHASENNNIVSVTFNQIQELNPLTPDICIIDADFSKCNYSFYYQFCLHKSLFFQYNSFQKEYKQCIHDMIPILDREFGNRWCFYGDTSLFLLYEKLYPNSIPSLSSTKINVLVPLKTNFKHSYCSILSDVSLMRKYLLFCWKITEWNSNHENIMTTVSSFNHKMLIITTNEISCKIPKKENIKIIISNEFCEKLIQDVMKFFHIQNKDNVYLLNEPSFSHYNNINVPLKDLLFSIYNKIRSHNYNITKFYHYPLLDFDVQMTYSSKNILYWKKIISVYQSCVYKVLNPFPLQSQYTDTGICYDHIIIGSDLTGRYLAQQLEKKFPDESILILEEDMYTNNSFLYFDNCHLPFKNVKSFGEKDVLTKRLLQKYKKETPVHSVVCITEEEKKQICKIIFRKYTIDIEFLLEETSSIHEEKMYLIIESLSSIKELCCSNDVEFFLSNNLDIRPLKTRNVINLGKTISESCFSFSIENSTFHFLLTLIYSKRSFIPLNTALRKFQFDCLQSFSLETFGDFLIEDKNKQRCLLNNVYIHEIHSHTNKISTCVKLEPMSNSINSTIFNISFKELYVCSNHRSWEKGQVEEHVSFHLCFPNTTAHYQYFIQEKLEYFVEKDFIWTSFHGMEECLYEIDANIFTILSDFYYQLKDVVNITPILIKYIPLVEYMKHCLGFIMTKQKGHSFEMEDTLYQGMIDKMNITSNIHYLNYTFLPSPIENSFYMVEKFMSQMRRIGLFDKNIRQSFVGFQKEYNIENCNFIFCVQPCNTNIYKPIVFSQSSILFMLIKDGQEIQSFKHVHRGYFNVYCSMTDKIKYEKLYFDNERGIEFNETFHSDNFSVLTYYIWNEKKYIASVRHKFKKIYGFQFDLFNFYSFEYNNQINFLKSL